MTTYCTLTIIICSDEVEALMFSPKLINPEDYGIAYKIPITDLTTDIYLDNTVCWVNVIEKSPYSFLEN